MYFCIPQIASEKFFKPYQVTKIVFYSKILDGLKSLDLIYYKRSQIWGYKIKKAISVEPQGFRSLDHQLDQKEKTRTRPVILFERLIISHWWRQIRSRSINIMSRYNEVKISFWVPSSCSQHIGSTQVYTLIGHILKTTLTRWYIWDI